MRKKWVLGVFLGILVLSLTACTGASVAPEETQPTEMPEEPVMDADEGDGADADADADTESGSDADQGDAEEVSIDAAALFSARCSGCHGADRSGANGPPLLPGRLTKGPAVYTNTITNGSGPMPAWGSRLSAEEISALVEFILSEVE